MHKIPMRLHPAIYCFKLFTLFIAHLPRIQVPRQSEIYMMKNDTFDTNSIDSGRICFARLIVVRKAWS